MRVLFDALAVAKLEVIGVVDLQPATARGCSSHGPFRYDHVPRDEVAVLSILHISHPSKCSRYAFADLVLPDAPLSQGVRAPWHFQDTVICKEVRDGV